MARSSSSSFVAVGSRAPAFEASEEKRDVISDNFGILSSYADGLMLRTQKTKGFPPKSGKEISRRGFYGMERVYWAWAPGYHIGF